MKKSKKAKKMPFVVGFFPADKNSESFKQFKKFAVENYGKIAKFGLVESEDGMTVWGFGRNEQPAPKDEGGSSAS